MKYSLNEFHRVHPVQISSERFDRVKKNREAKQAIKVMKKAKGVRGFQQWVNELRVVSYE